MMTLYTKVYKSMLFVRWERITWSFTKKDLPLPHVGNITSDQSLKEYVKDVLKLSYLEQREAER